MKSEADILRFIGLAMRAGAVVSGFDAAATELRKGNGKLIITATDISTNTMNKLMDLALKCENEFPGLFSFSTMKDLGWAIGRPDRAIVVITDSGFAKKLTQMLEEYDSTEDNT